MIEYILLAVMAVVVILLMLLRTNTAICFLALCAGTVLLASSGTNLSLVATSLTSGNGASTNVARIALLFGPLLATALILRGQVKKSLMPLALIPAAATAFLGAIYIAPELSDGTEAALAATDTWTLLTQNQEVIVVFGLVISVVMIALTVKRPEVRHKKGKH